MSKMQGAVPNPSANHCPEEGPGI